MDFSNLDTFLSGIRVRALRHASLKLKNMELAEEAVAETILGFLGATEKLKNHTDQEATLYFFGILRKKLIRYYSSDSISLEELAASGFEAEAPEARSETSLLQVFDQFDSATRSCLLLVALGKDHHYIAKHFEISLGSAYSRVVRARNMMQLFCLEPNSYDDDLADTISIPKKMSEDHITINGIQELTGLHARTIKSRIASLKPPHRLITRRDSQGHVRDCYSRKIVIHLLNHARQFKFAGSWKTANMIAQEHALNIQFVQCLLARLKIENEMRWHADGRLLPYYNPEMLHDFQKYISQRKQADGWVTLKAISQHPGMTNKYRIKNDIIAMGIEGESRTDCHGVLRLHYPPDTISKLKQAGKAQRPSKVRCNLKDP